MLNKLEIKDIRNKTITLLDGTKAAVLNIKPLDLDKMSESQKMKAKAAYGAWLNQLTYPIQIVGRTINANLEEIMTIQKANIEKKMKEEKKSKLLERYLKFQEWLNSFIKKNCREGRLYYIAIPYQPGKNEDNTVLNERVDKAEKMLSKAGLKVKRLNDNDLKNLYSSYFTDFLQLNKTKYPLYMPNTKWIDMWSVQQ